MSVSASSGCANLLNILTDPLRTKGIHLSDDLPPSITTFWKKYFALEKAQILPMPINRAAYDSHKVAQTLFGGVKDMLEELEITPYITAARWQELMNSDHETVRWIVKGNGKILSWSLDDSKNILESTVKRISSYKKITIEQAENLTSAADNIMPMSGCHQDMLSLLAKENEKESPVIAYGYITFEKGSTTISNTSFYEDGTAHQFNLLEYIKHYFPN
jgi:hypothetical protein